MRYNVHVNMRDNTGQIRTFSNTLFKEEQKMAENKINDAELNEVTGGAGGWQKYAKGSYVNYGNYIVYTVA